MACAVVRTIPARSARASLLADVFVALRKDLKLPDCRDRVVRHGHGPHRAIQSGVGPVEVRRAKVRDRGDGKRCSPSLTSPPSTETNLRTSDEIDKFFLFGDLLFWKRTGDRVAKSRARGCQPDRA